MTDDLTEAPRRARRALDDEAPEGVAVDDTAAGPQRGERFLPSGDDEAIEAVDEVGAPEADPEAETSDAEAPQQETPLTSDHTIPDAPHPTPEAPVMAEDAVTEDVTDTQELPEAATSGTSPDQPGAEPAQAPEATPETTAEGEVPSLPVPAEHLAFMRPDVVQQIAPEAAAPVAEDAVLDEPEGAETAPAAAPDENATAAAEDSTPAASEDEAAQTDELSTKKKASWLGRVLAAVLVLGLAAGGFWLVKKNYDKPGTVTVTQTPSMSRSTTPAVVTDDSLITPAEAAAALGSTWSITQTLKQVTSSDPGVTCMNNSQAVPNAVATRQRVMTAASADALAMLQRIDTYATEEQAKQAYTVRLARLSACDDIAAYLQTSDAVSGLADEAYSMTITFQNPTPEYHTVVIARTGSTVQMGDVTQTKKAIATKTALPAITDTMKRLCGPSKGMCPATPEATVQVPPATQPVGWLAQSDMPRITAGAGLWSATQPTKVTTKGSQCEDVTLASVTGATKTEQRSYILGQDEAAPEGFGVDQVKYEFGTDKEAAAFAKKLGDNVANCAKRLDTAKVDQVHTLNIFGENKALASGRIFLVTQSTSANTAVRFRVSIASSGNRVTYLVANTTESFDFTAHTWLDVSARAAQRITQTR